MKYRILECSNQTLHLIGRIIQVLGPRKGLGPYRVLVLGPLTVLVSLRDSSTGVFL